MFNDKSGHTLKVAVFNRDYQEAVVDLILDIQKKEFGIAISADDQPDLHSIPDFYQTGDGNFWVALLDDHVVGTVALIDIGQKNCAMRKMFVHRDHRGGKLQIGHKLLKTAIGWCRQRGVGRIWLGTTSKYLAAHRFYEKNGFVAVERDDLPAAFPVMKVDSLFYTYPVHPWRSK